MNPTKYRIIFILILAFTISACKKNKPIEKIIQPIDIQLNRDQAIQYGDLTIYPIIQSDKPNDTNLLTLQELIQIKGFNPKKYIQGNRAITNSHGPTDEFFWANKTNKDGITLLGEIFYDDNENISFLTEGNYLPAKKITQTWIAAINSYGFSTHSQATRYLLPCPPTPLKSLLDNNIWEAGQWLRIALPKIHSTYKKNEDTYPTSMQKIADEGDHVYDDYDNDYEHGPMEDLGSLFDFTQAFEPIGQNKNTGCLVTYKDKILISYYFDSPRIFQKEWPFLIKSFYLNQLMGHSEQNLLELSDFEGTKEVQNQIEKLWIKKRVTPEDSAFRGKQDGMPYYLVFF